MYCSLNICESTCLQLSLVSPFSHPLLLPLNLSLQGFSHPSLSSPCTWPGRRGGSHSRHRAACRPPVPSSTSHLYTAEPGRPPPGRWSWWSSPSPPAPDALPAPPARSGTCGGIKLNESENNASDWDGQMGGWEDCDGNMEKTDVN